MMPTTPIPTTTLPDGTAMPLLGQGTWFVGDEPARRVEEIATLRRGIELGMTLVDTAEMYGDGRSEDLVGEAIAPLREEVFLVDKVLPSNASRRGTIQSCERSLEVLGTEYIDLYLLHWPRGHGLDDTVEAFEELVDRGLIGAWGVSNFDVDEFAEVPGDPQVNLVLYNPSRRGPEFDLFPSLSARRTPVVPMAYSPIEQGRLLDDPTLAEVADRHGASVAQILLAWVIRTRGLVAIPKASSVAHVEANAAAAGIVLSAEDLAAIDRAFPAPASAEPLEIL